ncbi:hypothetical protein CALCODRAFT_482816 [Calocera cornea HHB12733]|uniref:Uncharacterized protein n=1 Tax=Calocera cornea HHB12733 TaxID=1353952 RepID=A0A165GAD4_9BASI|nr:hypothetical protein CALCODRAFT_482816 [Calocera cornea HHB12733]
MLSGDQALGKRKKHQEASRSAELLEVEDDDARESRLGKLLAEKASEHPQDVAEGKRSHVERSTELPLRLGRLSEPLPIPGGASSLIARLDAFLPSLKASNQALLDQAARDPNSVDIEHLTPGEGGVEPEHIEMNLGLGVFTLKKDAAAQDPSAGDDQDADDDSDDEESAHGSTDSTTTIDDESDSSSGRNSDGNAASPSPLEDSRSPPDAPSQESSDGDRRRTAPQPEPHRPPAVGRVSP